jgi:hypothetical protein
MTFDLRSECARLAKLGQRRPSASARKELEEALASKWEGLQVTAARSLAAWGDEKSVAAIRALLETLAQKPAHWASTGAVADALKPLLRASDAEWVLQLCFERSNRHNRFALYSLLAGLPYQATLTELQARIESGGNSKELRAAMHAFMNARGHAATSVASSRRRR